MNPQLVSRPRPLAALLAATLALVLTGQLPDAARADGTGTAANLRIGHTVKQIEVPGSFQTGCPTAPVLCRRKVDVHLWYPADERGLSKRPKTVYRSALWHQALPGPWVPLSWEVEAESAREDAPIDPHGRALPVIVFSHGSNNDPIDYAHTLEEIAGAGFVVAAPYHVNNTQDDLRIDYINAQAHTTWFTCNDGIAPPCSRTNVPDAVPHSMRDRVSDISQVLDALPDWFRDRVDVSRAGVLGHSRGTVTALAAAGGSAQWGFGPLVDTRLKPRVKLRVKAIMGLAIGAQAITDTVDLAQVKVPTVLVAGGLDQNSVQAISEHAFATISSADKLLVEIPHATHRSFDSTYCAQLQSAAAHAKKNPNAILDLHTVGLIAASAPGFLSGKAVHYCAPSFFTAPPVNIQRVVASTFNAEYSCSGTEDPGLGSRLDPACSLTPPVAGPPSPCVTTSIPCTGLDTDEVKRGIAQIAVAFFHSALRRSDHHNGIDFERYLAPKWLMQHVPMVGSAQAYAGPGSICPPGQGVICTNQHSLGTAQTVRRRGFGSGQ